MLRASLESDDTGFGCQRPRRRRGWIEEALEPLRNELHPHTYRRISAALTRYFGIEPIIVVQSMADLPREVAIDASTWSATALVTAAMNEPQ